VIQVTETWPRQPFIGLAIAAALGILVADYAPNISPLALSTIAILAAIALFWQNSFATYTFVAGSFFYLHSLQLIDTPGLRLAHQIGNERSDYTVRGFVINEPRISPNGFVSFLFKLQTIEKETEKQTADATIFVRSRASAQFGDELQLFGSAGPVPPPRNPGEFDMRSYLARRDVHTQLFVSFEGDQTLLQRHRGNPVRWAAQQSRRWMQNVLARGLEDSPELQGLIGGMVLGVREETPEEIEEQFQQTGTLHLFAVSGLNVAIVAQLLWTLGRAARLSRKSAIALIIPSLFFYAAVTGFNPSSVRAALMAALLLGGYFADRKVLAGNSLAAAAVLIFCFDTQQLFSTGFQLSFAVVTTIILFADPFFNYLNRWCQPDPFLPLVLVGRLPRLWQRCWRAIALGIAVSLAAWIGSLPLIIWYFNLVTPISVFANLVVVPIAFFILAAGLLSIMAAPISSWLCIVFNNANWISAKALLSVVHFFAQLPGSHFYVERPHWPSAASAEMTVLDVGTGGAAHVRTGHADWMFDCGAERDFERVVRKYLRTCGVDRLDGCLLTHGDASHLGGASALLRDFSPRHVIDTRARDRSPVHRALIAELQSRTVERTLLAAGDELHLSRRVTARVLFPPNNFQAKIADDQAMVLQLFVDNQARVLFVSDSGSATEGKLLRSGINLHADVLIKGQHHSGISGSPEFIAAIDPRLIIASSRNFPNSEKITDEWATMVRARGIKLFRQDESGAIELKFFRNGWIAHSYFTGETLRNTSR
jgi:competence protein ComEC